MSAAIRHARSHLGLTATNPSVAALIVRDDGDGPRIVGRAVTAVGGRPHAEPQALQEAGALARGATAYVTLEPCAHHGGTPPCAEALVAAGVARVVCAVTDPDPRVAGRGYAILRAAGIEVSEDVCRAEAEDGLAGYLMRSANRRPEVTLKLAVSADGMIGRIGEGQVAITGEAARRQVHMMRAEADAILVGIGTALADDPELTCRLPGLESRSPVRIVLDPQARLPLGSKLVATARDVPVLVVASQAAEPARLAALEAAGVTIVAVELAGGVIPLPGLLGQLATRGISTLLVEGGAKVAGAFMQAGLVDKLALFRSSAPIGEQGIAAPAPLVEVGSFDLAHRKASFGADEFIELVRSR